MRTLFKTLILLITIASPFAMASETVNGQQKVLILLGAPGSGKGTQAIKISKELHLPHISTGDLFRENLKKDTDLGKKAKSYMDAGKLVPDEIVQDMLFKRISEKDVSLGYILDGFPRTMAQAKVLDAKLKGKANILVVNLNVPDAVLIERIVARGKASSGKRSDDTAEIAKKRLHVYHEETEPLVNYYETQGLLVTVDGERPLEQVSKAILDAYQKRMK